MAAKGRDLNDARFVQDTCFFYYNITVVKIKQMFSVSSLQNYYGIFKEYSQRLNNCFGGSYYNKGVLKEMEPHHPSTCSTLLNVPLKLMRKSRIPIMGFGFFSFYNSFLSFLDMAPSLWKLLFAGFQTYDFA